MLLNGNVPINGKDYHNQTCFVLTGGAAVKAGVQEGDRIIKVFSITTRFTL